MRVYIQADIRRHQDCRLESLGAAAKEISLGAAVMAELEEQQEPSSFLEQPSFLLPFLQRWEQGAFRRRSAAPMTSWRNPNHS